MAARAGRKRQTAARRRARFSIPDDRGWWEGVVQISTPSGLGTGTYIAPDVILTAAHVIAASPGDTLPPASQVEVTTMYGQTATFAALDFAVPAEWSDGDGNASLFDIAVIRPSQSVDPSLRPVFDFRTGSGVADVAAFGFSGSSAPTLWGKARSFGRLLESDTIVPLDGMSGGPLIRSGVDEIEMVGVVCARAQQSGTNAAIALAFAQSLVDTLTGP